MVKSRSINNYRIETVGGFVMVKHWIVYDKEGGFKGIFFKFKDAKEACLSDDFSKAYMDELY